MSARTFARVSALAAVPMLVFSLMVLPVQADSGPGEETACVSCHEDLYYLHDTGKWYCVTEAGTRCTDCHDGDPSAIQEAAAHTGLIAYPVRDGDTSRCQGCHLEDTAAHVQEFARVAGISQTIHVSVTYTPRHTGSYRVTPVEKPVPVLYPWLLTGTLLLVLLLGGTWVVSRWIWGRSNP